MIRSLEIVHKDLESKRKCIKYFTHKPECCEFLNQLLKEIDKLEVIEKELMILDILLNHLEFMGEHKTSLKLINNGCVSNDLFIVKQYLLSNKVGVNND